MIWAAVDVFCLLQDENDNPPEFSKSSYIVKIPENIIAGESLYIFRVTVLSLECIFGLQNQHRT